MKRVKITFPVPRASDYHSQCKDVQVLVLAKCGQHTKAIAKQLGISPSQAQYRILKGLCRGTRRDFRDGKSDEAKIAVKAISVHVIDSHVRGLLQK